MLLHKDKELFREVVISAAEKFRLAVPIVEKDYYVIDRFSEDIDIAFSNELSQSMRKHLKNDTIAGISNILEMPILDWENTRSRRDYNCYTFSYDPLDVYVKEGRLIQGVKMEVSLASLSFPTVKLPVESYVYQYLIKDNMNIADEYSLHPFVMNVQRLDRTLADKVFAICDYYLQGKVKRYSRHIYDIYMLLPVVELNEEFKVLVGQVREVRSEMSVCPSAAHGADVPKLLKEIIEKEFYKEDYYEITTYFQNHPVSYENAIEAVRTIAESGMFV